MRIFNEMPTLLKLAAVGGAALAERFVNGDLDAAMLWTAVRGADKCRRALAAGDIVADEVADERISEGCMRCSAKHERALPRGYTAVYCGKPVVEDELNQTCGCFVALVHPGGAVTPECATRVASKACPRGYWKEGQCVELTVSG